MPGDISKAIKELESSLKDIEVNKSYREDKIPWKRLLAAAGVSMLIVMIIVAVAVSIAHDMDIPELDESGLDAMMHLLDGRSWYCDSDARKILLDDFFIHSDGVLRTWVSDGMLCLDFGTEVLKAMPSDGHIRGYIGRKRFIVYFQEGIRPAGNLLIIGTDDAYAQFSRQ